MTQKGKVNHPISSILSYTKLSNKLLHYTLALHHQMSFKLYIGSSSPNELQNYEEVCKHPKWIADMESETKALQTN